MAQNLGAFVRCGAGGEDIVHQSHGFSRETLSQSPSSDEGASKVGHALTPAESGLGRGVARPPEGIEDGGSAAPFQFATEFEGLVELSLAESARVQGHGDGEPTRLEILLEAATLHDLGQEFTQEWTEVELALVLEAVDEFTHHASTLVRCHGVIEGEVAAGTGLA